jgi:hypothetical protein
VFPRIFQPAENLQPFCAGERGKHGCKIHIDN